MKKNMHSCFWILTLLFGFVCFNQYFQQEYSRNRIALLAIHIMSENDEATRIKQEYLTTKYYQTNCRVNWLMGFIEDYKGKLPNRNYHWEKALECEPLIVDFLSMSFPEDRIFAQTAVRLHPEYAESWFWLANTFVEWKSGNPYPKSEENRTEIIQIYEKGLKIAPYNALRWREFADLLKPIDPHTALEAYLQSCLLGDPGSNGCYRAGQTAEELGDNEFAIQYYRYSHWEGALNRADELEAQLMFED